MRLPIGGAGYRAGVPPPFTLHDTAGPVVATAIHHGHDLRPSIARRIALDEPTRRREEDPHTARLTVVGHHRVVVHRSRFEVDLNRPRTGAVYQQPDDAWGLRVWREPLPADEVEESLTVHDQFYARLGERLDVVAEEGPFVVLDIHSYNHRREGPNGPPASLLTNPEINVGTGSLDRRRWTGVVDGFICDLRRQQVAGHHLDVRENVRFRGGFLARWVHDRYPDRGCALAIELKKTFMDEWTDEVDDAHVDELVVAFGAAVPGLVEHLRGVRV